MVLVLHKPNVSIIDTRTQIPGLMPPDTIDVRPPGSWAGFEEKLGRCIVETKASERETGFRLFRKTTSGVIRGNSDSIPIPEHSRDHGFLHVHPESLEPSITSVQIFGNGGEMVEGTRPFNTDAYHVMRKILGGRRDYSFFVACPELRDEHGSYYYLRANRLPYAREESGKRGVGVRLMNAVRMLREKVGSSVRLDTSVEDLREFMSSLVSEGGEVIDRQIRIKSLDSLRYHYPLYAKAFALSGMSLRVYSYTPDTGKAGSDAVRAASGIIRGFETQRKEIEREFGPADRADGVKKRGKITSMHRAIAKTYQDYYLFNDFVRHASSCKELDVACDLAQGFNARCGELSKDGVFGTPDETRSPFDYSLQFVNLLVSTLSHLPQGGYRADVMRDLSDLMLSGERPNITNLYNVSLVVKGLSDAGYATSLRSAYMESPKKGRQVLEELLLPKSQ